MLTEIVYSLFLENIERTFHFEFSLNFDEGNLTAFTRTTSPKLYPLDSAKLKLMGTEPT